MATSGRSPRKKGLHMHSTSIGLQKKGTADASTVSAVDQKQRAVLSRLFAKRPAKPGEAFGAPGQGSSSAISTVTIIALFALWFVMTATGLRKPLFLPSPKAGFDK